MTQADPKNPIIYRIVSRLIIITAILGSETQEFAKTVYRLISTPLRNIHLPIRRQKRFKLPRRHRFAE